MDCAADPDSYKCSVCGSKREFLARFLTDVFTFIGSFFPGAIFAAMMRSFDIQAQADALYVAQVDAWAEASLQINKERLAAHQRKNSNMHAYQKSQRGLMALKLGISLETFDEETYGFDPPPHESQSTAPTPVPIGTAAAGNDTLTAIIRTYDAQEQADAHFIAESKSLANANIQIND